MDTLQDLFGPPIYGYSRAQAFEDGFLVDLMQDCLIPVCKQHYKFPIACTRAVWDIIERAVESKRAHNDLAGVVHDILWMSRTVARPLDDSTVLFKVYIIGGSRKKLYEFKMICGPGDTAAPVLTIMLPEED